MSSSDTNQPSESQAGSKSYSDVSCSSNPVSNQNENQTASEKRLSLDHDFSLSYLAAPAKHDCEDIGSTMQPNVAREVQCALCYSNIAMTTERHIINDANFTRYSGMSLGNEQVFPFRELLQEASETNTNNVPDHLAMCQLCKADMSVIIAKHDLIIAGKHVSSERAHDAIEKEKSFLLRRKSNINTRQQTPFLSGVL